MNNTKEQLIKLGSKNKDLRPHLRRIIEAMEPVKVKTKGNLRIIEKGHSYSAIFHPKDWKKIVRGEPVVDEQGNKWTPEWYYGNLTLSSGSKELRLDEQDTQKLK